MFFNSLKMKIAKLSCWFFLKLRNNGYILITILFITFISLHAYKAYLKISTKIESSNGISTLEKVVLGGHEQWIFIRGTDQNNPLLIFLHGGPGEPVLGMASSRYLDSELIKHFTVVHWDQLGAGKSYDNDIPVLPMTMACWIEDCNALIDYLTNKFNTQKVFLVGHSGGTILGLKIAQKYPEKIYAYVGVSQIVNYYEQQRISYNFIVEEAEKSGNKKILRAVNTIGPPPYPTHVSELEKSKYIVKLGGFIQNNVMKRMGFILSSYLFSPEYSILDGIKTLRGKGLNFTRKVRYEKIREINFIEEIQSLKTPVYLFQGKYDMITPTCLTEEFYDNLNATKGKRLIIFENSAHLPILEEKEKYQNLLINVVLKEYQNTKF